MSKHIIIQDTTKHINKILHRKSELFISKLLCKIKQISNIETNKRYIVYNNKIIEDNRYRFKRKFINLFIDDKEILYNFIRINIDHCINISQITISHIENNKKYNTIYSNQYKASQILSENNSLDYFINILFKLTKELSNTINGINNLILNDYYNILLCDTKKIISIYILYNLNILFKYYHIVSDILQIDYSELVNIQNQLIDIK